jgi:hypothetical protein
MSLLILDREMLGANVYLLSQDVLPRRDAVDYKQVRLVLLQDHERLRCRGRRCSRIALHRSG